MGEKSRLRKFFEERLGWQRIFAHPVPKHSNKIPYVLGGTLFILGVVQGITGLILQQFYNPDPSAAYESVSSIMSNPSLTLVRSLHYWMAQLIILLVILHMTRVFVSAAFKRPREIQWLVGVFLLLTAFLFAYSGTILKWDQEAVEALAHNVEVAKMVGLLGYPLLPEFAPNIPLLVRNFEIHTTVVPVLVLLAIGLHFTFIRIFEISSPKSRDEKGELKVPEEETVPFGSHVKRMIAYGLTLTLVMTVVAIILPAPLGMKGVEGIEVSKPPWYFLWFYSIENIFGISAIPYIMGLIVIALIAVPLLDRKEDTDPRRRKFMVAAFFVVLFIILALMILGSISAPAKHF